MPKDKNEMKRRLRRERKDKGLVELRVWLRPEHKAVVELAIKRLNGQLK